MSSIRDTLKKRLAECGLWPAEHVDAVIELVEQDEANASMAGRWTEEATLYPPEFMTVAWNSARQHALDYIDRVIPKAWYRSMFE